MLKWILLLLFSVTIYACGDPQAKVGGFTDQVQQVVTNNDLSDKGKIKRLESMVHDYVDMSVFTRQVIGRTYWSQASNAQKTELVDLVFKSLVKDYSEIFLKEAVRDPKLAQYRKKDGRYQVIDVNYSDKAGKLIKVSYAVFCKNEQWKIFDLSVNGVHLSSLQNSQYKQYLENGGVAALIKQLESA